MLSHGGDISGASKNYMGINLNIGIEEKCDAILDNIVLSTCLNASVDSVPRVATVYDSEMSM